jgi:excisionase family DNA binding protein
MACCEQIKMQRTSGNDHWLSINDAAKYIGVSRATLYTYMSDGRLPFYYIKGSNQRRIKQSDLDALLIPGKPEELEGFEELDE